MKKPNSVTPWWESDAHKKYKKKERQETLIIMTVIGIPFLAIIGSILTGSFWLTYIGAALLLLVYIFGQAK